MSRPADSRDVILEAAQAVVAEQGAVHLTLEAVAARAGMSKGGLLYHFRSKELLLQGMITKLLESADADRRRFANEMQSSPAGDLQAHIRAGFLQHPDRERVSAALLAAGANDPRLLDPVRAWQKGLYEELVQSKQNPVRAVLIMLAVDGLWLNELLRTLPIGPEERLQVQNELLELAKSTA